MLQLTDEDSNSASAVNSKISKTGGYKIQNRQIVYDKFTPNLWKAKIKGADNPHVEPLNKGGLGGFSDDIPLADELSCLRVLRRRIPTAIKVSSLQRAVPVGNREKRRPTQNEQA